MLRPEAVLDDVPNRSAAHAPSLSRGRAEGIRHSPLPKSGRQEVSRRPARIAVLMPILVLAAVAAVPAELGPRPKARPSVRTERDRRLPAQAAPNTVTAAEKAEGWVLLFDGRTFDGWRGLGRAEVPAGHWTIEDGCIRKIAGGDVPRQADGQPLAGGDLMTIDAWRDFELAFEWRISPGGNSGVKYNVSEEMSAAVPPGRAALGFEYQVLDDDLHPDAANGPHRTAAALYDLLEPAGKRLRPVGEFNAARIVFRGGRGEHWLNGVRVLDYDLGSPDMAARLERSKYRSVPGFADIRAGHIVLQDHGDAAWYRSLKLRPLPSVRNTVGRRVDGSGGW